MLYTQTDKIKISTVGASFTVTFTVAPDEIGYLTALHEKYAEMNMCGFTIKPSDSEKKTHQWTSITKTTMFYDCDRYVVTNDEGERAYNCIGCEQMDCAWKGGCDEDNSR